jgi:hypothetical protein
MTDDQLQTAIDKAREFMNLVATNGGLLYNARQHTAKVLIELEAIQVNRAAAATTPILMRME